MKPPSEMPPEDGGWVGGRRWLTGALPARLRIPVNEPVLQYLHDERPFAHSDLVLAMFAAAEGLEGVVAYCPNPKIYRWVSLCAASSVIFALSVGMRCVAFRVADDDAEQAVRKGARIEARIGPGWVSVDPFDPIDPTVLRRSWLRTLARAAHRFAESPAGKA